MTNDDLATLIEAKAKAQRLLAELEERSAEVNLNPPAISAEALAEGAAALKKAIESARRLNTALDQAIQATQTGGGGLN